jgi:photosystem II stability/assembly factor-like uncharacterized protein
MKREPEFRVRRLSTWLLPLIAMMVVSVTADIARATAERSAKAASPARTWENYFGATILPNNRVVVVGDKGLAMTSDDQGVSWRRSTLEKDHHYFTLYSVAFAPDGSRGWAVGDGGAIFRSDDQGGSWTVQQSPRKEALLKVAVIDQQKACAIGDDGVVECTSDGGATWKASQFPGIILFDVAFSDANHGWAVGEFSTILRTTDGGNTWTVQSGGQRLLNADPYFALGFQDQKDGMILGLNGAEVSTADGGATWTAGQLAEEHHSLYSVARFEVDNKGGLYAGGADGALGSVSPGRINVGHSPSSNSITAVAFAPRFGIAVGLAGTIMRSEDGGQNWNRTTGTGTAVAEAND